MRDPHVERLHFEISSGEGISFENPEPRTFENSLGRFDARDGKLAVAPSDHFADEAAARSVIEPFLRSWEIGTDLESNPGTIRFKFLRVDIVDRDPPPPGSDLSVQLVATVGMTATLTTLLILRKYPQPPSTFEATPDVVSAHARWLESRAGHEPLQAMGYFVLTLVQWVAGGRTEAADVFQIDLEVLRKIGELTTNKGGPTTARKAPQKGEQFQELTGTERAWLEQAVPKVIKRLGEHEAGATLTMLTFSDLPKL